METKQCTKNLTCDCTTHHGTRPVCKVSDLNLLWFLELQGSKLNNNNNNKKQKNWENELFVISPLLVMQFLPYFRKGCMLPIATILQQQN